MDHPEVLVPFFVFFFVAAMVIAPIAIRSQERKNAIDAVKRLAEQGNTPPPELMAIIQQPDRVRSPDRDLRWGMILLAVSASMITMAVVRFLLREDLTRHINAGLLGASSLPGFIGIVLIGFWAYSRNRRLDD